MKTLSINSSNGQANRIYETYEDKNGNPISGHYQYRADIEVTEFSSEFSKKIYNALIASGRKNLANKYSSDIPANQRLTLFTGQTKAEVEIEIAKNSSMYGGKCENGMVPGSAEAFMQYKLNYAQKMIRAYGLDKELAKINDFKFPRFGNIYGTMTANEWWEKSILEIIDLIGENGWVEINGEKIKK